MKKQILSLFLALILIVLGYTNSIFAENKCISDNKKIEVDNEIKELKKSLYLESVIGNMGKSKNNVEKKNINYRIVKSNFINKYNFSNYNASIGDITEEPDLPGPDTPDLPDQHLRRKLQIKFKFYDENGNKIDNIEAIKDDKLYRLINTASFGSTNNQIMIDTFISKNDIKDGYFVEVNSDYNILYPLVNYDELDKDTKNYLDFTYDLDKLKNGVEVKNYVEDDNTIYNFVVNIHKKYHNPIPIEIKGRKIFVDKDNNPIPLEDGQFKFILRDGAGNELDRTTNDSDGNIKFSPLLLGDNKIGNNKYFIEEIKGNNQTIDYDAHKEEVNVNISIVDRYKLKSEVFYNKGEAVFENKLINLDVDPELGPDEPEPDPEPDIDSKNTNVYIKIKYHLFDSEGKEIGDETLTNDYRLLKFIHDIRITGNENETLKTITHRDINIAQKDSNGYYILGPYEIDYSGYIDLSLYIGNYKDKNGKEEYRNYINKYYDIENAVIEGIKQTEGVLVPNQTPDTAFKSPIKYDINIIPRKVTEPEIKIKKKFLDENGKELKLEKDQFKFNLINSDGKIIDTTTNDENGNISFKLSYYIDDIGKNNEYFIKEVEGDNKDIEYDTHEEKVIVNVSEIKNTETSYVTAETKIYYDEDGPYIINRLKQKQIYPFTGTKENLIIICYLINLTIAGMYIGGIKKTKSKLGIKN